MLDRTDLHDYQHSAVEWMTHRTHGMLWLDCGLGKTLAALTAVSDIYDTYPGIQRTLVVAPKAVATTVWPGHLREWSHIQHLDYAVCIGAPSRRRKAYLEHASLTFVNYENLVWIYAQAHDEFLKTSVWPWDIIIFDELSKMKSYGAVRVKNHLKFSSLFKRRYGLTATPAANSYMGIWSQHASVDERRPLGKNISAFRARYFYSVDTFTRQYSLIPRMKDKIHETLGNSVLRLEAPASDAATVNDIWIDWDGRRTLVSADTTPVSKTGRKIRDLYKTFEAQFVLDLEEYAENVHAVTAAALAGKLRQYAGGAVYQNDTLTSSGSYVQEAHTLKISALLDLLDDLNGQPAFVLYQYKHERDRIQTALRAAGLRVRAFTSKDAAQAIQDWDAGKLDVLLAHPASAGHGINLQHGGHHVIWFTVDWDYELYYQANKRIDRQGQKHAVMVHRLLLAGTIDRTVVTMVSSKGAQQETLLDAVRQYAAEAQPQPRPGGMSHEEKQGS